MQHSSANGTASTVQEPVNKNIDLSPPMSSSIQQLAGQGNGMQLPLSQQGNYAAF